MNFSQFLQILRARKMIVLMVLAAVVATALVVSLVLPKTYKATATVLLNNKGLDPVTGFSVPGQLMPGYMATQIDIISSKSVALRVVDSLKLAQNPAVIQQFNDDTGGRGSVREWLATLLLKKLEIVPSRESSVIDISFKGADPDFAAAIANAFASQYQALTVQLKAEPMQKAATYFDAQTRQLRDALESAQSRMSKYQQENGIVSLDNRLDVENNRLNDLSMQLVAAQAAEMEASSRRSVASGHAGESPDVVGNPLIQNMMASLSLSQSKLADIGQRLGHNHPQYQAAKAEAEQLRANLAAQMRATSGSVGNNASILGVRETSLRGALDEQKTKVLALNRTRDELNILQKDVESAQRAFDAATMRLSQTRMEGQANQSDVSMLNPAVAPIDPSSPRVLLNTALALFLGSLLGMGAAVVAELLDRRVRSASDLTEVAGIALLGNLTLRPVRQRSRLANWLAPRRLRLN